MHARLGLEVALGDVSHHSVGSPNARDLVPRRETSRVDISRADVEVVLEVLVGAGYSAPA